MLSSLFGDLRAIREADAQGKDSGADFSATAIFDAMATEVDDAGQLVDSHQHDMVVSGSPALAIRDHFAATRADLDTATRMLSLYDPTGLWAAGVIKSLSDATGRPIERLHLREPGTLRTLAVIERTTLVRRDEDPLRIYHADVRAPGAANAAIPFALMEHSHMTAVIVGAMSPHAIGDMLNSLRVSVSAPNWRCPTLLFMLPPNAVWIANKISMTEWPARLKVQVLSESLGSASAVWNALLGMWNRVKKEPIWSPPVAPPAALDGFPIRVADFTSPLVALTPSQQPMVTPPAMAAATRERAAEPAAERSFTGSIRRPSLDMALADHALELLSGMEGVFGCALVDADTGLILARKERDDQPVQLDMAAAASTQLMRAHQQGARNLGLTADIDEVMTSAGPRHHVMRSVARYRHLFFFAVLDKHRTNLALVRYKLMEAEQTLG